MTLADLTGRKRATTSFSPSWYARRRSNGRSSAAASQQLLGVVAHDQAGILRGAALDQVGEAPRYGHAFGVWVIGAKQHLAGTDAVDQGPDIVLWIGRHVAEFLEDG